MKTDTICWLLVIFVLIAATASCAPAHAGTAIHAGGYSYHVATGHDTDYNDWHRLAAVEHGSVMAGYFRNSYHRDSFIAAYGWSKQYGDFRASVHVGAVYGYRGCFGDDEPDAVVCPIAFPSVYYTRYRVQPGFVLFGEALAAAVRVELY